MNSRHLCAFLAAGLAGTLMSAGAAADEPAPAPAQLDSVTVHQLQRDAAIIPYARINRLLGLLRQHGQGLVRMDFKLESGENGKMLNRPQLAVQHADRYIPIALDADNVFELPVLPQAQADEADLASNQPKGSQRVSGRLHLTTAPDQLDMATVRRIMKTAGTLRGELLPWYARWLFPQVEGVRICSAQPQWELEWSEQGQLLALPLAADPRDRDPEAAKGTPGKPCTTLTGQEQWPDAAKLVAPADAKLSVRLAAKR